MARRYALSHLSSGLFASGPGDVVVDAGGADPIAYYSKYDAFGRQAESGRKVAGSANVHLGSSGRLHFDDAGLLRSAGQQNPNVSIWPSSDKPIWVGSIFGYDHGHHVTRITAPNFTRTLDVDALGFIMHIHDAPNASSKQSPPRDTCYERDVEGRLVQVLRPEGNLERYIYDEARRLSEIWKGYSDGATGKWADQCHPIFRWNGLEKIASFVYDANGFLTGLTRNGVATSFVVDGFGRPIDTILPQRRRRLSKFWWSSHVLVSNHLVKEYDTLGRVLWQGLFSDPPANYAKPRSPIRI